MNKLKKLWQQFIEWLMPEDEPDIKDIHTHIYY
jgi:hypothetical protein